jgi:mannose-6-phosphate isomerase-like protein (cupin superfamily)
MPLVVQDVASFTAARPWDARDFGNVEGASVRLHWTDQPYVWHVNDGREVFVVLNGRVRMRWRSGGAEHERELGPADLFVAEAGDEHLAEPIGPARILVIERRGSV